jgi:hypothetical protein
MPFEKIHPLIGQSQSPNGKWLAAKDLVEKHGAILDRIRNNTGRPKGKKPGLWPCQCFEDVKLLIGPENLEEIYRKISENETCYDRRAKLTLAAANSQFHSLSPSVKEAFIAQFETFGNELRAYKRSLEKTQAKR